MKRLLHLSLAALVLHACAFAEKKEVVDGKDKLLALSKATSVDGPGAGPWHLKMSFDLNDIAGKPLDKGTVDIWWTSSSVERKVITGTVYDLAPKDDAARRAHERETYLIGELTQQVIHPVTDYSGFSSVQVVSAMKDFGKIKLACLSIATKEGFESNPANQTEFCTEPDKNILRVHRGMGSFGAVRNKIASFRGVSVGMDNAISYEGRIAIAGHIDTLADFAHDAADKDASPPSPPRDLTIPGVVLAGKVKKKIPPVYPDQAKHEHISGTVLLHAIISKAGDITSLTPIASPAPDLTDSAMRAVQQWKYEPYLLDGQPTEVDTTITVNYHLGS